MMGYFFKNQKKLTIFNVYEGFKKQRYYSIKQ